MGHVASGSFNVGVILAWSSGAKLKLASELSKVVVAAIIVGSIVRLIALHGSSNVSLKTPVGERRIPAENDAKIVIV